MRAESEVARAGAEQEASKAKARNRRISKGETHQTQPSLRLCVRFRHQTFSSFKGAVPFKLRLSASEWRFALTSFAARWGGYLNLVIFADQERSAMLAPETASLAIFWSQDQALKNR